MKKFYKKGLISKDKIPHDYLFTLPTGSKILSSKGKRFLKFSYLEMKIIFKIHSQKEIRYTWPHRDKPEIVFFNNTKSTPLFQSKIKETIERAKSELFGMLIREIRNELFNKTSSIFTLRFQSNPENTDEKVFKKITLSELFSEEKVEMSLGYDFLNKKYLIKKDQEEITKEWGSFMRTIKEKVTSTCNSSLIE